MSFLCCSCSAIGYLALIPILFLVVKFLYGKWRAYKVEKMLERWSNSPRGVVILHSTKRGKTMPTLSPFALKVETYMRMCGIKYEMDTVDRYGPKGKFPWISFNGEYVADSEFIIEFLAKKFENNFSKNIDKKMLATATLSRIVLEEHFFWGMAMERFLNGAHHLTKLVQFPPILLFFLKFYGKYEIMRRAKAQGIGLHSDEEIVKLMKKDLKAISVILGNQKFICGDEPCEEDCALFGMLGQIMWGLPYSPYESYVKDELKNIVEYCDRMKTKFWPDWDRVTGT